MNGSMNDLFLVDPVNTNLVVIKCSSKENRRLVEN